MYPLDAGVFLELVGNAKQRHGSTGKVNLQFEAKITKFSDLVEPGYYAGGQGS